MNVEPKVSLISSGAIEDTGRGSDVSELWSSNGTRFSMFHGGIHVYVSHVGATHVDCS